MARPLGIQQNSGTNVLEEEVFAENVRQNVNVKTFNHTSPGYKETFNGVSFLKMTHPSIYQ